MNKELKIERAGLSILKKSGSAGTLAEFAVKNRFSKYLLLADNGMTIGVSETPIFYKKPIVNRLLGYNF